MSGYIGPIPVPQGIQNKESFTATAAQTTFNTNGYTDGAFISVYLNGVRLVNGTDYTATNGSDVVLASAANTGDVLDFETFNSFSLASQQFENITTKNPTHEDTDGGRESALSFQGEQSGGEISTLAVIQASHDGTADDQKGDLIFKTNDGSDNNAPTERLRIDSDGSIVPATLGTSNVKLGLNAGKAIASGGNYNTVIGEEAGAALSTGDVNTFVGYQSGDATTTSGNNVGVGYGSLTTNILSSKNVAIGNNALKTHNLGSAGEGLNVAVGHGAGESVTTAIRDTLIGSEAGDALTTGQDNVAVGALALSGETAGNRSVAIGRGALKVQNFSSSTAANNVAIGYSAGESVTTGTANTLIGSLAGDALTVGELNTAIGVLALSADDSGSRNTVVGYASFQSQNPSGSSVNNMYNTGLGYGAGSSITTGYYNTFIGALAGDGTDDGNQNVAVGIDALGSNCDNDNTAVGSYSLAACTGAQNTCLGSHAGHEVTSGTNLLLLGKDAGRSTAPGGSHTTGANSIVLGDNNSANAYIRIDWTVTSDERDKTDFTALDLGLDFVKSMKPYTFKWDQRSDYGDSTADDYKLTDQTPDGTHKKDQLDVGFKAQDIEALEKAAGYKIADKTNLVASLTQDETQYGLKYSKFIPILTKAIQELSAKNDALETENTAIKARLDALEAE